MTLLNRIKSGVNAIAAVALAITLSAVAVDGSAQPGVPTPSVVPRADELAPKPPKPDTDPSLLPRKSVPRELQKPDEEVVLDVLGYAVPADSPDALKAALSAITAPYVGKGKSWEDLVNAKDAVTRYLQSELGYYLGYAFIPEQTAGGGIVQIAVLEGRLDRVRLIWDDKLPVNKAVVESYLAELRPGAILTVTEVERVVFLINDLRGIAAVFEIEPGSLPGTANLVVRPRAEVRLSYKLDFDVNGSRFIGLERLGGQVTWSSPFGLGDSLALSALSSFNSGIRFALASYAAPVGGSGLRLGGAISAVRYELDKKDFPIGRHGTALNANIFGLYPLIRSRNSNLFTVLSLDEKRYDDREDASSNITKKRVHSIALAVNGDARDNLLGGGINSYDVSFSGGRVIYDGARPSGLIDAPNYTKVNATFSRIQNIVTGRLLGYISVRGQYGFKNLDTTEQFRLGGPDGVRAFANGEGTGDAGIVTTAELRIPVTDEYFGQLARETVLAMFVDYGTIRFHRDASQDTTLAGLGNQASYCGVGMALAWVRPGKYALRVSVALPMSGVPKGDPALRDPRVYAQFSTLF